MICSIRLEKNGEMILSSNGQEIVTHSLKCKEANSGYMSPGAMFMGALAGCKLLTFIKSSKYYKIDFEDLNIEVEADVVNTDNIGDTPFKNQEYSEIRTKYFLKTVLVIGASTSSANTILGHRQHFPTSVIR